MTVTGTNHIVCCIDRCHAEFFCAMSCFMILAQSKNSAMEQSLHGS